MSNKHCVVVVDTREKKNIEVLRYFDAIKQPYIVQKVDAGDYIWQIADKNEYGTIIDLKKDLVEVAGNIAGTNKEHERFKREIAKARELGCTRFVVLIRQPLLALEDVMTWQPPKFRNGKNPVRRSPMALYKTMKTFETRYGVEWRFTSRFRAGEDIIAILDGKS